MKRSSIAAVAAALLLTGCSSSVAAINPIEVAKPDVCSLKINVLLDKADLDCRDFSVSLKGDFTKNVVNTYDPSETHGVFQIVADEHKIANIWLEKNGGTCAINVNGAILGNVEEASCNPVEDPRKNAE